MAAETRRSSEDAERAAETQIMIKDNLIRIKEELPSGVKLVAVSKYHPSEAVTEAYEAGQRAFAESRPQELEKKIQALKEKDIEWHFIGHLQTNKLKMVLPCASMVESVDSLHLLEDINRWGRENGREVPVLLEMHIASEESKQGFHEEEILDLMFRYTENRKAFSGVRIRGLMGMATNTDDESIIEADFERIDSFMAYLVDLFPEADGFDQLSIGMSSDWHIAVRHGATIVRIGSAIFGEPELA